MLHDSARIEAALAPLVGLPLWGTSRAADLLSFAFGDKRTITSRFGPRKGQPREVGDYSVHVQCAWRIRGPLGIVVAGADRSYAPGPDPDAEVEKGQPTRLDVRVREWIDAGPYQVLSVSADAVGGIVLRLSGEHVLEVFPDTSFDGEYSEHWRVFRPADLDTHFVVSGNGIDDSPATED